MSPLISYLVASLDLRCCLHGGQQSEATLCRVHAKELSAVYVSAGTVNHGPGIYNTSLQSHHKTLMFINVNARDLYLNVIYMSQLKGVLMSGGGSGGGWWKD